MKIRINNKKVLMALLILLLLILAVGYAVFSETLTISGTANAKGTFDLEFQNAEIVKNVGADKEKTTVEISTDKNTLTVNAADLAYPGAGVEFSVDIVNVGTMPAEVQAVTQNNITGSDKIKVTGLDGIKVGHPKVEVGDRCNIHFTVEWPVDSGEILESESNISFGLQIEYTQAIGEIFDGQASHTDTDKEGNTINSNTVTGGEVEEPQIREGKLTEIIRPDDYGKSINYTATVMNNKTNENQEVSNWKVLYNDKTNICLIYDDYFPVELVPLDAGLDTDGSHHEYSNTSRDVLLNGLKTEDYWIEFASGIEGTRAKGTPEFDIFIKSYNEKYGTNINEDYTNKERRPLLETSDRLYVPHGGGNYYGVNGYLLLAEYPNSDSMWYLSCHGAFVSVIYNYAYITIRPVVYLPSSVTGTVGETIEINK